MSGWDPLLLVLLVCLAVIMVGPREYVSLAGFGFMGVIAAVLLGGRMDIVLPTFVLAGVGAVLLGVRTVGMLAGAWDQDDEQPSEIPEDQIWR